MNLIMPSISMLELLYLEALPLPLIIRATKWFSKSQWMASRFLPGKEIKIKIKNDQILKRAGT